MFSKHENSTINHIRNLEINQKIINAAVEELKKRNLARFEEMRPQLREYQSLKKELEAEKKKVMSLLLNGLFNDIIIKELNLKMESIETQLQTLTAQIYAITRLDGNDEALYKAGLEFISGMKEVSDAVSKTTDRSRLRTILPIYFKGVRYQKDGSFKFILSEPISSTNGAEWCAH